MESDARRGALYVRVVRADLRDRNCAAAQDAADHGLYLHVQDAVDVGRSVSIVVGGDAGRLAERGNGADICLGAGGDRGGAVAVFLQQVHPWALIPTPTGRDANEGGSLRTLRRAGSR